MIPLHCRANSLKRLSRPGLIHSKAVKAASGDDLRDHVRYCHGIGVNILVRARKAAMEAAALREALPAEALGLAASAATLAREYQASVPC